MRTLFLYNNIIFLWTLHIVIIILLAEVTIYIQPVLTAWVVFTFPGICSIPGDGYIYYVVHMGKIYAQQ